MTHAQLQMPRHVRLLRRGIIVTPAPAPPDADWRRDLRFFATAYTWGLGVFILIFG